MMNYGGKEEKGRAAFEACECWLILLSRRRIE